MEATLVPLLKFDESSIAEAQCQFFSEVVSVCSEEVEPHYQNLYERTEELAPPEVFECLEDSYVVACWTCSPEQAEDICDSFVRMPEFKVAAYIWCDEYEEYFIKVNETLEKVPHSSIPECTDLPELSDEWGEEDLEIIAKMQYLLKTKE